MKQPGLICTFFVFAMAPLWALHTAFVAGCDTFIPHDGKMPVNKVYKIWVFTQASQLPTKGFLHRTTDSSLILLDTDHKIVDSASLHHILITDIRKIAFRRKDNAGHGALAGGFFGMGLGTFLSFAFGDDDSVVNTLVVTPSGALMGLIASAARYKIRLAGSLETYQRNRASIRQYSLTKE